MKLIDRLINGFWRQMDQELSLGFYAVTTVMVDVTALARLAIGTMDGDLSAFWGWLAAALGWHLAWLLRFAAEKQRITRLQGFAMDACRNMKPTPMPDDATPCSYCHVNARITKEQGTVCLNCGWSE